MLRLRLVQWVALATLAVPVAAGSRDDGAATLAAARQALGGDAALTAVTTWQVIGSASRDLGRVTTDSALEISCVLPDKFVQVFRQTISMGPLGTSQITRTEGFNGDDPIYDIDAPDSPVPAIIRTDPGPKTPAEAAAQRARQTNSEKHIFARLTLALFATSLSSYPLDFIATSAVTLNTGQADVLEGKGPDGWVTRLFLDASTHLPVKITWMDKPFVTFATSTTVAVPMSSRGPILAPPASGPNLAGLPSGDPTAGMANVEWETTIGDYRLADHVNWPHRLTTTYAGRKFEEWRLGKFKINPKIDPKKFTPSK